MPEPRPGEKLCRDVFPAEVLLPDGEFVRKVRAVLTTQRLIIYRWVGEIDEVEYDLVRSVPPNKSSLAVREKLEVVLESGPAFVNRAMGCRCGPLGHMRSPFNF